MKTQNVELTSHEAQSIYAYIGELETYVENCEGEEDLRKMVKSYNRGGKLRRGISKLNFYKEELMGSELTK